MRTFSLSIALFFLRLFSFFLSCSAQATKMQQFIDAKCVNEIKSKFPEYLLRFKEEHLNKSCVKSRIWKDDAVNGKGKAASDPRLSPKQLEYFNSVTTCQGIQCLCDQWQICRDFVNQIKQGVNQLGEIGDQIKNGNLGDVLKNLNSANANSGNNGNGNGNANSLGNTLGNLGNGNNGNGLGNNGNGNGRGDHGNHWEHGHDDGRDHGRDEGRNHGHDEGRGHGRAWGENHRRQKRRFDMEIMKSVIKRNAGNVDTITEDDRNRFLDSLIQENARNKRQADAVNLLQKFGKSTRKEIRTMTDEERRRFYMVLNTLKTDKIEGWTKYDILTVYHTPEYAPGAHFGAAFLPFHREFLKNMEIAMRLVDAQVSLPYWDSTLDSSLPNPAHSILWTDDFFGNGNGEVTSGPFSNWTTIPDQQIADLSPNKRIVRGLGQSPIGSLFKQSDVDTIMSKPNYRNLVFCVDPFYELIHGATHLWVGGHMVELRISPNDPVFFVVHAWVDHLWEIWRTTHQNAQTRQTEFVPNVNETCNEFSTIDSLLKPYTQVKVRDGLSNKYTDQFYNYQDRPTCQNQCQNSPYLFCDSSSSKCLSKIMQNGNCTGFDGRDICYRGICTGGKCVPAAPSDNTLPPTAPPPTAPPPTAPPATLPPATLPPTTVAPATVPPPVATVPTAPPPQPQPIATIKPTVPTAVPTVVIQPETAPPKTGTQAPVAATVWAPITVLLEQQGVASTAYTKAKILTRASTSDQNYEGIVANPSDQPYYTGAAYAQMPNPFAGTSPVTSSIAVFDEFNNKCTSYCLNLDTQKYDECQNVVVTLDVDPAKSTKIATTPDLARGKLLNWKGYKRSLDNFMFLCNTQTAQVAPVTAAPGVVASTSVININANGKVINIATTNDAAHQIANGGCHNWDRCCVVWATVGECTRNPWMQNYCEWACHVCNPGENIAATECCDYHPKCPEWAGAGQCQTNAIWMEENCKESCKVCGRSVEDTGLLCGARKHDGGCKDYDSRCDKWSTKGECVSNPWWMTENCGRACNKCNVK